MKNKILQKASELFLNFGFKSVTMDDLANKMGISKKTIYSYFKNKDELVKASTEILFKNICNGIDGIIEDKAADPIEELYIIKQFVLDQLKGEKTSPHYQLQKYYPEIFEEVRNKQYHYMQDCVKKNMNKGLELGLYRKNLDVEFASRIYFLGMVGIKNNDIFPAEEFPVQTLIEKYLEYHLRGIVTKKGLKKLTVNIENYQNDDE